jgi:hypothetical protein
LGVPLYPRRSRKALPATGVARMKGFLFFLGHISWGFEGFLILIIKKPSTRVETRHDAVPTNTTTQYAALSTKETHRQEKNRAFAAHSPIHRPRSQQPLMTQTISVNKFFFVTIKMCCFAI